MHIFNSLRPPRLYVYFAHIRDLVVVTVKNASLRAARPPDDRKTTATQTRFDPTSPFSRDYI